MLYDPMNINKKSKNKNKSNIFLYNEVKTTHKSTLHFDLTKPSGSPTVYFLGAVDNTLNLIVNSYGLNMVANCLWEFESSAKNCSDVG